MFRNMCSCFFKQKIESNMEKRLDISDKEANRINAVLDHVKETEDRIKKMNLEVVMEDGAMMLDPKREGKRLTS